MEESFSDAHRLLAGRLRALRLERGRSLDALAELAGVSRSMISLIERGESSPTAAVLYRLSLGLGVPLASLFAEAERSDAEPIARRDFQKVWQDPETGYARRNLSPPGYPSPIDLVEILLPPHSRVAYDMAGSSRTVEISQQIWVLAGEIELTVGETTHRLSCGDCLAMRVDHPTVFRNPGEEPARYLVAVHVDPGTLAHGGASLRRSVP